MPLHFADASLAVSVNDNAAINPTPIFMGDLICFMVLRFFVFCFAVAGLRLSVKPVVSPRQVSATIGAKQACGGIVDKIEADELFGKYNQVFTIYEPVKAPFE